MSTARWMDKYKVGCACARVCVYIHIHRHTMKYYAASEKEIPPFATTWMNMKDSMLSEIYETLTCGVQKI